MITGVQKQAAEKASCTLCWHQGNFQLCKEILNFEHQLMYCKFSEVDHLVKKNNLRKNAETFAFIVENNFSDFGGKNSSVCKIYLCQIKKTLLIRGSLHTLRLGSCSTAGREVTPSVASATSPVLSPGMISILSLNYQPYPFSMTL